MLSLFGSPQSVTNSHDLLRFPVPENTDKSWYSLRALFFGVCSHDAPSCRFSLTWGIHWKVKGTGTMKTPRKGLYMMETFFLLQMELFPRTGLDSLQRVQKGVLVFQLYKEALRGVNHSNSALLPSLDRIAHVHTAHFQQPRRESVLPELIMLSSRPPHPTSATQPNLHTLATKKERNVAGPQ